MNDFFHPMPPYSGSPWMSDDEPIQGPFPNQTIRPPYAQPLPNVPDSLPPIPREKSPSGPDRGFKNPLKGLLRRRGKALLLSEQMYQVLGQRVNVCTYTKELDGEVAGVYPDHLLISKEDQKFYIRWDAIVYVSPKEEL
ncbi:DUF2642 domain-containing protein [Melghirimyces algeriensis]|uniref:Uncharacterized protein n=1 Tax=Melghirimyces algeriensis TaxID=910412 RepID=A0A521CQK7_9BACL|nr:DUF2642 domain-containing protein [Melghirimyces algeriensis]SMO61754.1 Protein of unknown function [Melghirimyces algeriensis]